MESLYGLISFGAVYFASIALLINILMYRSIRKIAQPDKLLDVIENGRTVLAEGLDYAERTRWAESHGFVPDMIVDFRGALGGRLMTFAVWRNHALNTRLSTRQIRKKIICHLITDMESGAVLSTCNSREALILPTAPGCFLQAFASVGLDELFRRHQEGLAYLRQSRGIVPIPRMESTDALIRESIRYQIAYVRTLPLWPLRGAWWQFIRQYWLNNKTIAEQYGLAPANAAGS